MGKKLLTKDYDSFVLETFSMPSDDFNNHYLNKMEEHYPDNKDIGEQLKRSIARYFDWYKSQCESAPVAWECDENGENERLIDRYKMSVPLGRSNHPLFKESGFTLGSSGSVSGDFFAFQIRIIERLITAFKIEEIGERIGKLALEAEKNKTGSVGKSKKAKINTPQKLEDIFVKPEFATPCIEILFKLNPPVLNQELTHFVGGRKHVFAIWIRTLQKGLNPFIQRSPSYTNKILADLLNARFVGLNTTKDLFTRSNIQNEAKITKEIESLITASNLHNLHNL